MTRVDVIATPQEEQDVVAEDDTCLNCFPGAKERGRLTEDIVIIECDKGWFLVQEPLHTVDVVAILGPITPTIDPCLADVEELLEDDSEAGQALFEATRAWDRLVGENFTLLIGDNPRHIWYFVNDLIDVGYDPSEDGDAHFWIYNRVAEIISGQPTD